MQKQNRPYTPAEDHLVMNAINVDRMYYREVAAAIERSTSSVTNRVATLRKQGHNIIPVVRMPFGDERTTPVATESSKKPYSKTPTPINSDPEPFPEEATGDSLRIVNWILVGVVICCVVFAVMIS
jgi:hypothetical protein